MTAKTKKAPASEIRAGFCADLSCFSRLIGAFGGGFWSHMTSIIDDETVIDSRIDRMGAEEPGVQRRPRQYLERYPFYVEVSLPCSQEQRAGWEETLASQVGKPYDKLGIIDFIDGRAYDRNWREQTAWFCDELGLWAQERNGIIPNPVLPPYRTTPGTAFAIDMAAGARVRRYRGRPVEAMLRAAGVDLAIVEP